MLQVSMNGRKLRTIESDETQVYIHNPAKESGFKQDKTEALSWLNSASVRVNQDRDEVQCVVSVDDPRGGFVFTVRRLNDGRIVIHFPYPGESLPHMAVRELHEGTYEVGVLDYDEPDNFGEVADFG